MTRGRRVASEESGNFPVFSRTEDGPQHHHHHHYGPRKVIEKIKEEFYEELKPLWIVQKVLGIFPYSRSEPGNTKLKFFSAAVLYCLTCYVAVGYADVLIALTQFGCIIKSERKFNEIILSINFLMYQLPHLFSLPCRLLDGTKMTEYFNLWLQFQVAFKQVTGKTLQLKLKKYALIVTIASFFLSTVYIVLINCTFESMTLWEIVFYVYSLILLSIQASMWCFTCLSLKISMIQFSKHFQSVLHTNSEKRITAYRDLWLHLSKLTNDAGNANKGTVSNVMLFFFSTTLLSLYGVLSGFLSSTIGTAQIMLGINSAIGLLFMTSMCDFAFKTHKQIGTDFVEKLSAEISINKALEKEMRLFLTVAVINTPVININGFAVMNRTLTVSIISRMVTYLVVLAQFGIQDKTLDQSETINLPIPTIVTFSNYTFK